jgi:hypothetical protein
MFRTSTVPIIRSYQLYTWELVCFMQVMWPLPSRVRLKRHFQPNSVRQRPHNLLETYQLPRVLLITPDDGHSRCPKHVEFRDKMKFWILEASCWLFVRKLYIVFWVNVFKNTLQKFKSLWIDRSIKQWLEDILRYFIWIAINLIRTEMET